MRHPSLYLTLSLLLWSGLAAGQTVDAAVTPARMHLLLPKAEQVQFRGLVDHDKLGMAGQAMLYPGYGGLAGLLGGILAHGAIVSGVRAEQLSQAEKDANQAIAPLEPGYAGFTYKQLLDSARTHSRHQDWQLTEVSDAVQMAQGQYLVTAAPVIWVSTDMSTLIADVTVSIARSDQSKPWTGRVRALSAPLPDGDSKELWVQAEGQRLRNTSAQLVAKALDAALHQHLNPGAEAGGHKTVRYTMAGQRKAERAQLLQQDCTATVLKTLRGDVLILPATRLDMETEPGSCADKG